ncbi:hypothetical protein RYX36_008494, partial [Vicia faba]
SYALKTLATENTQLQTDTHHKIPPENPSPVTIVLPNSGKPLKFETEAKSRPPEA